ncbi:MAG: HEAT repeat domain-containing protein [Myxococcota bacterium]
MSFLTPRTPTFEAALRDAGAARPEARLRATHRLVDPPPGAEARARQALGKLAADPVGPVRAAAVEALGHLGGEESLPIARNALEDADAGVRQHAVIAAARLGDLDTVRAALGDGRPEVRFQATGAFVALRPAEALPAIGPRLDDPDAEVRAAAVEALGESDDPAARDPIAPRLQDPEPSVRWAATLALAALGDRRATPSLRAHLSIAPCALQAAEALGRLGAHEARDDLRTLARRWWISPLVRAAAAGALARLGDPLGERTLRRIARTWRPEGRAYATELLTELGL